MANQARAAVGVGAAKRGGGSAVLEAPRKPGRRTSDTLSAEALSDLRGQIAAINKVQAVIEFDLEGMILTANENFLDAMGYSLEEVRGRHHRMFVDADLCRGH